MIIPLLNFIKEKRWYCNMTNLPPLLLSFILNGLEQPSLTVVYWWPQMAGSLDSSWLGPSPIVVTRNISKYPHISIHDHRWEEISPNWFILGLTTSSESAKSDCPMPRIWSRIRFNAGPVSTCLHQNGNIVNNKYFWTICQNGRITN